VLYRCAQGEIEAAIDDERIDASVSSSSFLPSVDWLDPNPVAE